MAPSYVTSSFTEHATKIRFISECPLQWDGKRECLRYKVMRGNVPVIIWHLNLFLVTDIIAGMALLYCAFQILRATPEKPYMPLPIVLILALIAVLCYYGIVGHVMITLYGKDAVSGFNEIINIEGDLVGTRNRGQ
ncbi:hypothetical protein Fcan01_24894 [Folsomia candida]|uniref:Uncharacterized protein n=1 Tax=Folsomia candida TaxID=158441 RepID=A0A226D3V7_FOLCA|nr:hypothetical protein Fcan01_24894 [Folsomia candida]